MKVYFFRKENKVFGVASHDLDDAVNLLKMVWVDRNDFIGSQDFEYGACSIFNIEEEDEGSVQ